MSLPSQLAPVVTAPFMVNGRTYRPPARPVVVVCIDGCADEYLSAALARGRIPHVAAMTVHGYWGLVRGALPSFTNVNNCAIVTGTPPRDTGIGGNYILDPATGEEVMTNSARFLRNETILAAAAAAGRRVAMVTAKDKLCELLSKNLTGIAFSAEKADQLSPAAPGLGDAIARAGPAPSIYSAEASLYVLRAGAALIEARLADFCYLTLTDYVQHLFGPEAPPALDFYGELDRAIGRLLGLGAVVGLTADHGMNAKCDTAGKPKVIYLETRLRERFGPGFRVICPITDPYVRHHGALGSAVTVYVPDRSRLSDVARWVLSLEGITEVYDREAAALKLELPPDRIGDLFVLSGRECRRGPHARAPRPDAADAAAALSWRPL